MSKSVDETVFDYFSLLLQEPSQQSEPTVDPEALSEKLTTTVKSVDVIAASKTVGVARHESRKSTTVISTQTAVTKQSQNRDFAEPAAVVDKLALEKLLSAVSKPATPNLDIKQQIKASAERVRQAISQTEIKTLEQAASDRANLQNKPLTDKEIKPLVDIKTDNIELAELKEAIIKHDKLAEDKAAQQAQTQTGATPPSITRNLQEVLEDEFQVLFFNVAGLTLAVPLVSLGGIIKIDRINHIIGRPSWFKGVQTHRDSKINVVDTCAWVMPEKYTPELAETVDYQYLVMLENSDWGLTCESLVNAVKIDKSHVNWREKPGKRPWLAGVVKQQMCGILHVQALIEMLDAGLGCQDSIDRG
ncbi:chemotaxis protein CheW [Shewanella algicola]|uniref:Chemotaxis protein CheW n=1 Tax=Shewanella algicola TaxID=640633 RepID=A0A9X2CC73_9GAMM|nr:chemotaxis protein CheW [Shewanella algicola]MCL1104006.1 chemotaxis protein CheW [Shewanella algicola]GGP38425.1 chemotaxis protein CheW [Shewanella algicola]